MRDLFTVTFSSALLRLSNLLRSLVAGRSQTTTRSSSHIETWYSCARMRSHTLTGPEMMRRLVESTITVQSAPLSCWTLRDAPRQPIPIILPHSLSKAFTSVREYPVDLLSEQCILKRTGGHWLFQIKGIAKASVDPLKRTIAAIRAMPTPAQEWRAHARDAAYERQAAKDSAVRHAAVRAADRQRGNARYKTVSATGSRPGDVLFPF